MGTTDENDTKAIISYEALFARCRRLIGKHGKMLLHSRSATTGAPGTVYIIATRIERTGLDLETLARELGALKPYEALATDAPADPTEVDRDPK